MSEKSMLRYGTESLLHLRLQRGGRKTALRVFCAVVESFKSCECGLKGRLVKKLGLSGRIRTGVCRITFGDALKNTRILTRQ